MFLIIFEGRVINTIGDARSLQLAITDASNSLALPGSDVILQVAEILWQTGEGSPNSKIPPELARAVDAWNKLCENSVVALAKVKKATKYLAPYRRWKRENRDRNYLLEQLVELVADQTWSHSWISFGWLFGKKNGEANSEKLRNGKFNGPRRNDSRIPRPDDEFTVTER